MNQAMTVPRMVMQAMFGQFFKGEPTLSLDNPAWMTLTNASVQYVSAFRPGKTEPQLVKRMHYVSFVGMFRSDLFEGLCVGHAPKKCPICGRWFLTIDARHTKYCGGLTPRRPAGTDVPTNRQSERPGAAGACR